MSDEYILSCPEPIIAPQPATALAWAARRWSESGFDSAMAREHRARMQQFRKQPGDRPPNENAAFSLDEGLRSAITALSVADAELERWFGLLYVTRTGLRCAADALVNFRRLLLTPAGPGGVHPPPAIPERSAEALAAIRTCFSDAIYGGKSLLSDCAGGAAGSQSLPVPADAHGHTLRIGVCRASSVCAQLEAAMAGPAEQQPGEINAVLQNVEQWIKAVEEHMDDITHQIAGNSQTINRLSAGLGPLVDVDLESEAARLKALQIQQQLSQAGVALGSSVPSTLVALFR